MEKLILFVGIMFITSFAFAEAYYDQEHAKTKITAGFEHIFDQSISKYTKAIENNPNYAGAYYNRAVAYIHKGNYDQAISDCTKAIEFNPNYVEACRTQGIIYPQANYLSQTKNSSLQEEQITGEEYAIYSSQFINDGFKQKLFIVIPNQTTIPASQFNSSLSIFDSLLANIRIDEDEKDMSNKLYSLNEKAYKIEDKFDKEARVYFMSEAEYQDFKKDENGNFDWKKIEQKYPDAAFFNISRVAFDNDRNDAFFYYSIESKSGTKAYYIKVEKGIDQFFGFEMWSLGATANVKIDKN